MTSSRKENSDPTDDSPDPEMTQEGLTTSEVSSPPASPAHHTGSPRIKHFLSAKIHSPAASPSASILKRRRLSGDVGRDSPSPPHNKVGYINYKYWGDIF